MKNKAGIAEWFSSALVMRRREFDSLYRHHIIARLVKLVAARDLKSCSFEECRFESGSGHQLPQW